MSSAGPMVRATRIVSGGISDGSSTPGFAPGEDAQQPVREIIEIALALAPVGIALAQHARPRAVLDALDGGVGREPALHGFAQTPLPAAVVGEHAIGLENLAMLARHPKGARDPASRRARTLSSVIASSRRRISSAGSSASSFSTTILGSCSMMWPSAMPFGDRLARARLSPAPA